MTLEVEVQHRLGDFRLEAAFASTGRLTALFGPSGSGKSSLIRVIAGLIRPDAGRVVVDGEVLVDTARGLFLPRHRRRIGTVFQEGRLFPHLTVRRNLLFGRFFTPRADRYGDVAAVVERLGIAHLLARYPGSLSGGEKQRVAIGRALLASPRLLLMDEPLASLDEARKEEILPLVERLRDEVGVPIVYVSHSVAEVARLATTVVALTQGRVAAVGPPDALLARPELLAGGEAREAGAILAATVASHEDAFGLTVLRSRAGELRTLRLGLPPGTPVRLRIRARDVLLARERPAGLSALNLLPGLVAALEPAPGGLVAVRLDCGGEALAALVTAKAVAELALAPGEPVWAVIKSVALDPGAVAGAPQNG